MTDSPGRPREIAFLVKRFPRLSETFILGEFLELRRQGLPVRLVAIMDPEESRSHPEALALVPEVLYLQDGPLWRAAPAVARTVARYPAGTGRALRWLAGRRTRAAARNLVHAMTLIDRIGPPADVHVYAHFLHSPAAIAFLVAMVSGHPYSLSGHAKDIYTEAPDDLRARCARATFVATCTEANRAHLVEEVGLRAAQVKLCRHGIDVDRFTVPDRAPRPGRILSIGRLVPKKGYDVLLGACGLLQRRGIAFELRIVGAGPLREDLAACAAREGVGDRVTFVGSVSQDGVVAELAAAEIFALAPVILPDGDRDGVPNVLMEAMASRLPVVATAVSGIPEVVRDGDNGRLVPSGDPAALADALAGLLADPEARARLAAAGRADVERRCTWPTAIQPLVALLAGPSAPAPRESLREEAGVS